MSGGEFDILALRASLFRTLLTVGFRERAVDTAYLLGHPALVVRSVVAMHVVMPLVWIWPAVSFAFRPTVKLGLFAMSLGPVPALVDAKTLRRRRPSFLVGTLTVMSLLSVIIVGWVQHCARMRALTPAAIRRLSERRRSVDVTADT